MKKYLNGLLVAFCFLLSLSLFGQSSLLSGFKYQAVLRDEASQALVNQEITLRVRISGNDAVQESFYSEMHKVKTDQNGLFELIIGQGNQKNGVLADLPWAEEQLWLEIDLPQEGSTNFRNISKSQLMAVPYALHAANTSAIYDPTVVVDEPIEKTGSQSIYWTTSGNLNTNPNVHFVGSRDNVNVVFKTNGKAYMTLTPIGKLELISDVPAGPDNLKSSYPVVVEGTLNTQGVWVEINGSRAKANNFVTFADDNGIQGRIEGQTLSELEASDSYKTMVEVTALNAVAMVGKIAEQIAKAIAETAATAGAILICGLSLGTIGCSDIPAEAAGAIACSIKVGAWTVELISYLAATGTSFDRIRSKVGVSYSSGSGDYAEYLIRKPGERDMVYGEIVGVNGGIVSRNTLFASRAMVVSQHPAFLGKTPVEGTENNFEQIAFMGQVPVRIVGKVKSGDYILPSGKNDGLGLAVHPEDVAIADYDKIVGVAWETIDNDLPFNFVNVGVGIKSNQLAGKVDELETKVNNIMNFLEGKGDLHPTSNLADPTALSKDVALPLSGSSNTMTLNDYKPMSNEEFDQMIDKSAGFIKPLFAGIEKKMKAQGKDVSHPVAALLFKDPVRTIKRMHSNPKEFAEWALSIR